MPGDGWFHLTDETIDELAGKVNATHTELAQWLNESKQSGTAVYINENGDQAWAGIIIDDEPTTWDIFQHMGTGVKSDSDTYGAEGDILMPQRDWTKGQSPDLRIWVNDVPEFSEEDRRFWMQANPHMKDEE